jgi:hypothetical protein
MQGAEKMCLWKYLFPFLWRYLSKVGAGRCAGSTWRTESRKKYNFFVLWNKTPAVFVTGRCSLTQHFYTGSLPWLWCACSEISEKPKEATRRPLLNLGSKTCQHDTMVGVFHSTFAEPGIKRFCWPIPGPEELLAV